MRVTGLAMLALLLLGPLLIAIPSHADVHSPIGEALAPLLDVEAEAPDEEWDSVTRGLDEVSDPWLAASRVVGLTLATLLGGAVAYHPRMRAPRSNPGRWEGPKAILVYAIAGYFTAKLVVYNPAMAFVVFGIGQLLRFRTDLGQAKETGRAIIAVLVGLACGLDMFAIALIGTAFFWGLMYVVEARSAIRLEVRKLPAEAVEEAARVWSAALEKHGCRVRDVAARGGKGRVEMVVQVPTDADVETLVRSLDVPEALAGTPQWSAG